MGKIQMGRWEVEAEEICSWRKEHEKRWQALEEQYGFFRRL